MYERTERFINGINKADRGLLTTDLILRIGEDFVLRKQTIDGRSMRCHHPFGDTGRTRCVNDVCQMFRGHLQSGEVDVAPFHFIDDGPVCIQRNDIDARGRQPGPQVLLRQQYLRLRIRKHVGQPLFRIGWIHRQVGSPSLHHCQQSDNEFDAALGMDADEGFTTHAVPGQITRQLIRPVIELAIGHPICAGHERGIPGMLFGAMFEETVNQRVGILGVLRIKVSDNLVMLETRQDIQIQDVRIDCRIKGVDQFRQCGIHVVQNPVWIDAIIGLCCQLELLTKIIHREKHRVIGLFICGDHVNTRRIRGRRLCRSCTMPVIHYPVE